MKKLVLLAVLFSLSSCGNPFGGKSLVENLKNLTQIFTGPAGGDVTSGGNATQDTNPGVPAQNYKVTMSINHLASPTVNSESGFTTNGGYKVYMVLDSAQ